MTLSEPARRLWLLAYDAIEKHVNALSRGPHEIRLGGGTVLAARWKHRTSFDIDLTLSPEAKIARLTAENNPALDATLRALGGTPEHEPPNYRVRFETGWIDIATLEPRPAKGATATTVHGKTVQVLSTTQILRGKLERGTRSPVRDVFDFVTARAIDRGALAAAVNCLAAPRIHEIAFWWVLLTNWRWVLDTLQQAAAAEGHDAIERDIVQLRGLTEPTTSSPPRSEGHDERPDVSSDARHVGRPHARSAPDRGRTRPRDRRRLQADTKRRRHAPRRVSGAVGIGRPWHARPTAPPLGARPDRPSPASPGRRLLSQSQHSFPPPSPKVTSIGEALLRLGNL